MTHTITISGASDDLIEIAEHLRAYRAAMAGRGRWHDEVLVGETQILPGYGAASLGRICIRKGKAMKPGKRMRELLNVLQDDGGELWNDGGMWSTSCLEDGTRFSGRVPADPACRLRDQGYVMYKETRGGMGLFGADRVVFVLTDKGNSSA